MKTLLLKTCFAAAPPQPSRPRRQQRRAFSLVEVTLALGIVTFGLVSVVGVLPAALASGRQSFDQNRAAAIANTLFTSFRSQPFSKVCYVDEQFTDDGTTASGTGPTPLNLNLPTSAGSSSVTGNSVILYARILSLSTDTASGKPSGTGDTTDNFGTQRRLVFFADPTKYPDSKLLPTGSDYCVAINFYDANTVNGVTIPASNQPDGMVTTGQACRLELVISAVSRPGDLYRFVSTVANRSN